MPSTAASSSQTPAPGTAREGTRPLPPGCLAERLIGARARVALQGQIYEAIGLSPAEREHLLGREARILAIHPDHLIFRCGDPTYTARRLEPGRAA